LDIFLNLITEQRKITRQMNGTDTPQVECSICFEANSRDASVTKRCNHSFHKTCLEPWLKKSNRCPYCRRLIAKSTLEDDIDEIINLLDAFATRFFSDLESDDVGEAVEEYDQLHSSGSGGEDS
jgi:hypothetical protein